MFPNVYLPFAVAKKVGQLTADDRILRVNIFLSEVFQVELKTSKQRAVINLRAELLPELQRQMSDEIRTNGLPPSLVCYSWEDVEGYDFAKFLIRRSAAIIVLEQLKADFSIDEIMDYQIANEGLSVRHGGITQHIADCHKRLREYLAGHLGANDGQNAHNQTRHEKSIKHAEMIWQKMVSVIDRYGSMPLAEVANHLDEMGITTSTNSRISQAHLSKCLEKLKRTGDWDELKANAPPKRPELPFE